MEANQKNSNLKTLIEIAKAENDKMYDISKNSDVKNGLYLTFHFTLLGFVLDVELYKMIVNLEIINVTEKIKFIVVLLTNYTFLMMSVMCIIKYLELLKNKETITYGDDFFDEKNTSATEEELNIKILEKSKKFLAKSYNELISKTKLMNHVNKLSIMTFIVSLVTLILNNIFY